MVETGITTIILCTTVLTLLTEALTWLFVYRTSSYKHVAQNIERAARELELAKNTGVNAKPKQERNKKKLDKAVKSSGGQMFVFKVKSGLIQLVVMASAWWIMSSFYMGVVMGRLPFEAPPFLRRATHYKIAGEDYKEVSFTFIYMLCQLGIRQNLIKLINVGPSRAVAAMMNVNEVLNPKQA